MTAPFRDSQSTDPLQRAVVRMAEVPVPLDSILSDLCEALALTGASLVTGKGLDSVSLASCGSDKGSRTTLQVPTPVSTVVHLYGPPPSDARVEPWTALLAGALARRAQSSGDPHKRLFSTGTVMRIVAHDLRNLLAVLDQNLSFVQQGLEELQIPRGSTVPEDVEQVKEATERVLGYIHRVHELAHILQGPWPAAPATDVLEHGLRGMQGPLDGIRGRVRIAPGLPEIRMDDHRVELLASELLSNARHASASRVAFEASSTPPADTLLAQWAAGLPAGPFVYLSCVDDGEGMDVFVLARCGEPMFSHPPRSDRTGLGFSLVQSILGAVGGHMAITSEPGQGTRVVLALPGASHPAPGAGGDISPLIPVQARLHVAVRISDPAYRRWIEETLAQSHFVVDPSVAGADVLIADRDGADEYRGPPTSFLYVGSGWPAGMSRPDAVMAPEPDRDGFIRRISMAVARRSRRT